MHDYHYFSGINITPDYYFIGEKRILTLVQGLAGNHKAPSGGIEVGPYVFTSGWHHHYKMPRCYGITLVYILEQQHLSHFQNAFPFECGSRDLCRRSQEPQYNHITDEGVRLRELR